MTASTKPTKKTKDTSEEVKMVSSRRRGLPSTRYRVGFRTEEGETDEIMDGSRRERKSGASYKLARLVRGIQGVAESER